MFWCEKGVQIYILVWDQYGDPLFSLGHFQKYMYTGCLGGYGYCNITQTQMDWGLFTSQRHVLLTKYTVLIGLCNLLICEA